MALLEMPLAMVLTLVAAVRVFFAATAPRSPAACRYQVREAQDPVRLASAAMQGMLSGRPHDVGRR